MIIPFIYVWTLGAEGVGEDEDKPLDGGTGLKMHEEPEARPSENLKRVRSLVSIYDTHLSGEGSGRRAVRETDLLRAEEDSRNERAFMSGNESL